LPLVQLETCEVIIAERGTQVMRKINTKDIEERSWASPKGKFAGTGKHVSQALGRDPFSTGHQKAPSL
jgi:hypothetical protein